MGESSAKYSMRNKEIHEELSVQRWCTFFKKLSDLTLNEVFY